MPCYHGTGNRSRHLVRNRLPIPRSAADAYHWNTIYLDQVVQQLRAQGVSIPGELLAHVAPLGWEHIALTGDYD